MGQESYGKFINLLELVTMHYLLPSSDATTKNSRMQNPDNELRTEGLISLYEMKKERLDRIHALDSSLINEILIRYGSDLSHVKIHTGPFAEEITHKAGADALTMGENIYFSSGSFSPDTEYGRQLLMHEAEHVEQHRRQDRHIYKEDIDKAEKQANSQEGLSDIDTENRELFDLQKQKDLIFKDQDLTNGLDIIDKDLADFSSHNEPLTYRYVSQSGRVHELSEKDYKSSLKIIKEKLEDQFQTSMMYSSDEEKTEVINKMMKIFKS